MKPKEQNHLIKFAILCLYLATQAFAEYHSPFSKHTFSQHQHIAFICLKVKLNLT